MTDTGFSDRPAPHDDRELVGRAAAAFRTAVTEFEGHGASDWSSFEQHHVSFLDAIRNDDLDALGHLLRTPSETTLFYGFDDLVGPFVQARIADRDGRERSGAALHRSLVQVAIAVGIVRCPNPEAGQDLPRPAVADILDGLDDAFGFKIDFPNPFAFEFGLVTDRGIASDRAIQALLQSWRLSRVSRLLNTPCDIVEIGPGLGRNAYYSRKFGVASYTLIDVPFTQLAQGYYLGRVLGAQAVSLCGEDDAAVRLRTPTWLHGSDHRFDIAFNVDSLTEMDPSHAEAYVAHVRQHARTFLSINHECNAVSVADLFRSSGIEIVYRAPYLARPGYVEEFCFAFDREVGAWRARLRDVEEQLSEANKTIAVMTGSRSWRGTASLRWIRSKMG